MHATKNGHSDNSANSDTHHLQIKGYFHVELRKEKFLIRNQPLSKSYNALAWGFCEGGFAGGLDTGGEMLMGVLKLTWSLLESLLPSS